jgi:hypothetical protein
MKHVKMKRGEEVADVAEIEIGIWQAIGFELMQVGRHQLDHDGDGKPGGSLPDSVAPRRRGRKPKVAQ